MAPFPEGFCVRKYFPSVQLMCEFSFQEDSLTSPNTYSRGNEVRHLNGSGKFLVAFRAQGVVMPVYCIHNVVGNMMVPKVVSRFLRDSTRRFFSKLRKSCFRVFFGILAQKARESDG